MLLTVLLATAALDLLSITSGVGCVSNNGPSPQVYDIVCTLLDPTQPNKPALRASAQGTSFIIEKNFALLDRYTTADALSKFGCDVAKTELGPVITRGDVAPGKIFFYHQLLAYWDVPLTSTTDDAPPTGRNGTSEIGVVANVFIADYPVDQYNPAGDWVDVMGFCNYWPAANTSSPNWHCTCESKRP